jgi:capsular polysaccharide biosynthesis protein
VVTAPDGAGGEALRETLAARGAEVVLVSDDLHVRLAAATPLAVVVDVRDGRCNLDGVRDLFFHVRPGGCFLTPVGRPGMDDVLARLRSGRAPVAREVSALTLKHGWLWLVSGADGVLAKLDEPASDRYIELRQPVAARVVERLPGLRFESRCELHQSTKNLKMPAEPVFEPPEMLLRELEGAICAPGQVVAFENVLMPDTYRHNRDPKLRNPHTDTLAPLFARIGAGHAEEPPLLPGTYYHLDNVWRGLFGHAMTEQVSRLWALSTAREMAPDLKVLVGVTKGREVRGWERELLAAAGISDEELTIIREPVRVERLLTASPMFSMPAYIHPGIAEVWRSLGDSLVSGAPEKDYPRRVFMTRNNPRRKCHNRKEVEALVEEYGFTVLRPELLSLPEQVRTFREAEVIAGFAGSGMFGALYATEPKRMITVTTRSYGPTNEYMIASVLGHRLDQLFCEPDGQGFLTPFTFDTDGHDGQWLRGVLADL